jgi:hypothetical protein
VPEIRSLGPTSCQRPQSRWRKVYKLYLSPDDKWRAEDRRIFLHRNAYVLGRTSVVQRSRIAAGVIEWLCQAKLQADAVRK